MCVSPNPGVCSLGFPSFGCRNSLSTIPLWLLPYPLVLLSADSWAMALPGRGDNWKAWWLAAGVATICESEWFGECCARGRGGRGLCGSQTASRGELLTPHRCQKAPRWPFAEPRLLMRKRVIIPLWGKYKHPDNSNKKAKSSRNIAKASVFKHFHKMSPSACTNTGSGYNWLNHCCYIIPGSLFVINQ